VLRHVVLGTSSCYLYCLLFILATWVLGLLGFGGTPLEVFFLFHTVVSLLHAGLHRSCHCGSVRWLAERVLVMMRHSLPLLLRVHWSVLVHLRLFESLGLRLYKILFSVVLLLVPEKVLVLVLPREAASGIIQICRLISAILLA